MTFLFLHFLYYYGEAMTDTSTVQMSSNSDSASIEAPITQDLTFCQ